MLLFTFYLMDRCSCYLYSNLYLTARLRHRYFQSVSIVMAEPRLTLHPTDDVFLAELSHSVTMISFSQFRCTTSSLVSPTQPHQHTFVPQASRYVYFCLTLAPQLPIAISLPNTHTSHCSMKRLSPSASLQNHPRYDFAFSLCILLYILCLVFFL